MALYDELAAIDIVTPILRDYKIRYTDEGKPVVFLESVYLESPWIHHRIAYDRKCGLWHIYFNKYGIIPRGCRQCWKVVMVVKTLEELLRLKDRQALSKYNCKCGLETRPVTGGLGGYRAFWYAPMDKGLAGGREMFRDVQREFPGIKLVLKRGCTEFEARYNPSDLWDDLAEQGHWDRMEELANTLFVLQGTADTGTPSVIQPSIIRRWIEYAYEHHKITGDKSCFRYLTGPPMPDYLQYNGSIHRDKDYAAKEYFLPREAEGTVKFEQNNESVGSSSVDDGSSVPEILLLKNFQEN